MLCYLARHLLWLQEKAQCLSGELHEWVGYCHNDNDDDDNNTDNNDDGDDTLFYEVGMYM